MSSISRNFLRAFMLLASVCAISRGAAAWSDNRSAVSEAIPPTIAAEAYRRRVPLASIKLLKGRWIACLRNEQNIETCIDLGGAGIAESPAAIGSSSLSLAASPRYQRLSSLLVRTADKRLVVDYVDQHADEPFLVVVSVPGLCEPCRRMEQLLRNTLASDAPSHQLRNSSSRGSRLQVKTFVLEYPSFAEAESQVLGSGALFPTILAFGPGQASQPYPALVMGDTTAQSVEQLSRKLGSVFKRGVPGAVARGALSSQSLEHLVSAAAAPH